MGGGRITGRMTPRVFYRSFSMGNPNHDDKGRFAEGPGGGHGKPTAGDGHPASQRGSHNMSGGSRSQPKGNQPDRVMIARMKKADSKPAARQTKGNRPDYAMIKRMRAQTER